MAKAETWDWYKRNPAKFIRGVQGMGPELIGAYSVILDLIYADEDSCPNDAAFIAGIMGKCSARKARALVDGLLKIGKLKLNSEGRLVNETAEIVLEKRAESLRNAREAGASGGRKAQANRVAAKENNDLLGQPLDQIRIEEDKRREEEEEESKKKKPVTSTPTPSAPGKATKVALPEGFPHLDAKNAAIMYWQKKGRPDLAATVDDQADQFRDHHTAHGGKMIDWGAAWRTWVRNALEMTRPPRPGQAPAATPVPEIASVDQWRDRLKKFAFGIEDTGITPGHPPGYWHHSFGEARPLEPGCKCPAAVLAQFEQQHPGALAAATKALARRAGGAGGR